MTHMHSRLRKLPILTLVSTNPKLEEPAPPPSAKQKAAYGTPPLATGRLFLLPIQGYQRFRRFRVKNWPSKIKNTANFLLSAVL